MKYVDNLLDWADSLFTQFTMESVNEALMLYIMASDILGPRPTDVGDCGVGDTSFTYAQVEPLIKDESEFLVDFETNADPGRYTGALRLSAPSRRRLDDADLHARGVRSGARRRRSHSPLSRRARPSPPRPQRLVTSLAVATAASGGGAAEAAVRPVFQIPGTPASDGFVSWRHRSGGNGYLRRPARGRASSAASGGTRRSRRAGAPRSKTRRRRRRIPQVGGAASSTDRGSASREVRGVRPARHAPGPGLLRSSQPAASRLVGSRGGPALQDP